jgi:hypothetical protein
MRFTFPKGPAGRVRRLIVTGAAVAQFFFLEFQMTADFTLQVLLALFPPAKHNRLLVAQGSRRIHQRCAPRGQVCRDAGHQDENSDGCRDGHGVDFGKPEEQTGG